MHVGDDGVVDLDHRVKEDTLVVIFCRSALGLCACAESRQAECDEAVPVICAVAGGQEHRAVQTKGIFVELLEALLLFVRQLAVNDASGDEIVRLQRHGDLREEDRQHPRKTERLGQFRECAAELIENQEAFRADGKHRLLREGAFCFIDVYLQIHGKPR